MKKYIAIIPLIVYPYAYILWIIGFLLSGLTLEEFIGIDAIMIIFAAIFIIYNVYILFIIIYNFIQAIRGKYSAYQLAKMNLLVKGLQIPAYIFHFIIGLIGFVMSIWGIGFIILAVVVDFLTIALTGLNALGCAIRIKKENKASTVVSVFTGMYSFVFCIDVIIAVVLFVMMYKDDVKNKIKSKEVLLEG